MIHVPSYPKVWSLGHPALKELFHGKVTVQEKVDGSQFSFGIIEGELAMRSKSAPLFPAVLPNKQFELAVNAVRAVQDKLTPGWIYRGEYLSRPKHNTLEYHRVPKNHVCLFDVETGPQQFASPYSILYESERLGFEPVRYFGSWTEGAVDRVHELMERESFLGGPKLEGLVFKNYGKWGVDGKVLMGKYVSEAFKEAHRVSWKVQNPNRADVIAAIIASVRTEARWSKIVQGMRDEGLLTESPKDIGPAVKRLSDDIAEECKEHIKGILWTWAKDQVLRGCAKGFAEWYKQQLLQNQFAA